MRNQEIMNHITQYRKTHTIFQKSIDNRSHKRKATTYDGPPFASGTPHFGHGLVSVMKDLIGRYQTMKGYQVIRRWGRDCHGLPVEKYVEKTLGLEGKKDIENKIGIQAFVEECRKAVKNVSSEWETFVDSIGRWTDMKNAYFTMDLEFMESVMRVFSGLYTQNLVYKGFKVQRYCPSCATGLANNEVNEGYKDRQDPAITVAFRIGRSWIDEKKSDHTHSMSVDGFVDVVVCVVLYKGKYLMFYHQKGGKFVFPGGRVEKKESIEQAVSREIYEELGVKVTHQQYLGSYKEIHAGGMRNLHVVMTEIDGEPINVEPEKHPQMVFAEILEDDNELGFAVKIEDTIINDAQELKSHFFDLYVYKYHIAQTIQEHTRDMDDIPVYALAWTTTPWTLPSNMFLATGADIIYVQIFDIQRKAYMILAQTALSRYYTDSSTYILINTISGSHLQNLSYQPLFPYIEQASIKPIYTQQFFHIINASFVGADDGTGIVHIAPAHGQDDFDAVCGILPKEYAQEWLFMSCDEYGEFTDAVKDYTGQRVYDANKDIISHLKEHNRIIAHTSYNHSYPHCRRCDTPLVSKAMSSRFIKEQELSNKTIPAIEDIHFVPEGVKNRFRDTLQSAPDRNVSRNRYRGAPIPIREAITDQTTGNIDNTTENKTDTKIVVQDLDMLYQHTLSGSQNITKHIFVRHGRTYYNDTHHADCKGEELLNTLGEQQAQELPDILLPHLQSSHYVIVVSPLRRTRQTIYPTLEKLYTSSQLQQLEKSYTHHEQHYLSLLEENKLIAMLRDESQNLSFPIDDKIIVDFRIVEHISPAIQNTEFHCETIQWNTQAIDGAGGESIIDVFHRAQRYIHDISRTHKTKTIVTVSHGDPITLLRKSIREFDYETQKYRFYPKNASVHVHYRDNDRNTEVDLHKPYVDAYWFVVDSVTYRRTPEILDCWFESGAMPYGQAHYLGEKEHPTFSFPADYIIEGLDQTRGRFRTLHVLGHGIMNKNTFSNIITNGLVLAEDGKKMSKKLRNYPDPAKLFGQYGPDAYRLYLLSSPGVRSEPIRFSEKAVEQIYKDFGTPLNNAFNFFHTYAQIDSFQDISPRIFAITDTTTIDDTLLEGLLCTHADIIVTLEKNTHQQSINDIQTLLKEHTGREIPSVFFSGYDEILQNNTGKHIILIAKEKNLTQIWEKMYGHVGNTSERTGIVPMPHYIISNDLDRWIYAELHKTGQIIEQQMSAYIFDNASKALLDFMDKLTNWFIRRSRRRFWAHGMDPNGDKISAYQTLLYILEQYCCLAAPFAPFLTENIRQQLQEYRGKKSYAGGSIHLQFLPIFHALYINQTLIDEIGLVRRIISLGLFVRSTHKIKVKQPLEKMEIQME